MTIVPARDSAAVPRMLWLIAIALALGGYAFVVAPVARAAETTQERAHVLYDEANADEAKVRRSAELMRVQNRVEADLRVLGRTASGGAVTARALRLFSDEGRRFSIDVRSVTPMTTSGSAVDTQSTLRGVEWNVAVRGRFADAIAFLSDLPRHDVLLDVHNIELVAPRTDAAVSPSLDVTFHATLYRLGSTDISEDVHAAATAR